MPGLQDNTRTTCRQVRIMRQVHIGLSPRRPGAQLCGSPLSSFNPRDMAACPLFVTFTSAAIPFSSLLQASCRFSNSNELRLRFGSGNRVRGTSTSILISCQLPDYLTPASKRPTSASTLNLHLIRAPYSTSPRSSISINNIRPQRLIFVI